MQFLITNIQPKFLVILCCKHIKLQVVFLFCSFLSCFGLFWQSWLSSFIPWHWFLLESFSILLKVGHRDPVLFGVQGTTAENSKPRFECLFKMFCWICKQMVLLVMVLIRGISKFSCLVSTWAVSKSTDCYESKNDQVKEPNFRIPVNEW